LNPPPLTSMATSLARGYLRGMDLKQRNMLTTALAVLFALGTVVRALAHDWFGTGLSATVVVLALIVLYRRRKAANAQGS
jgi:hypothetical protein